MTDTTYDLIVIGGGPAGTHGAKTAAMFGHRVALIEKEANIGGAGVNSGTVPSKTLRETALALSGWQSRRLFGVDLSIRRQATIGDLMYHADAVRVTERKGIESQIGVLGIEQFRGVACFEDAHTIRVTQCAGNILHLRGERILIATGSSPLRPPLFPFEDDRIHDSDELLDLKTLPKKLVIVGAGVIGSEYACTFAAMNVETHLADGRNELLPFLDNEFSKALADAMTANGVHFHWNARVTKCDASGTGDVVLTMADGSTLSADGVLVCAGRSSNTGKLNLQAAGVTLGERGLVPVDAQYRSVVPHIFAAGDVIGPPALASTGMEQARVAMCHAFGIAAKADLAPLLPTGIYTIPEVSFVGETEEALIEKSVPYVAGRARYCDVARGHIVGDDTGLLKLLFHKDDMKLLGVHVMGEHATELIHIGLIAMLEHADAKLFDRCCFNHPTLGELYKNAAYDAILQLSLAGNIPRLW